MALGVPNPCSSQSLQDPADLPREVSQGGSCPCSPVRAFIPARSPTSKATPVWPRPSFSGHRSSLPADVSNHCPPSIQGTGEHAAPGTPLLQPSVAHHCPQDQRDPAFQPFPSSPCSPSQLCTPDPAAASTAGHASALHSWGFYAFSLPGILPASSAGSRLQSGVLPDTRLVPLTPRTVAPTPTEAPSWCCMWLWNWHPPAAQVPPREAPSPALQLGPGPGWPLGPAHPHESPAVPCTTSWGDWSLNWDC